MAFDVGLTEVVSFEEQRQIERARKGIRKAVAEIERSGMASFAEFLKCSTGEVGLLFINWHEGYLRFCDEKIEISNTIRAVAGLKNH